MLVVPAVSVPVAFVSVIAPARFRVPAPPLISTTAVCAVVPEELKTRLPAIVRLPVVIATFAMKVVVVFVPPILTLPLTVADPALMFQAAVAAAVGWLIVTFPLTVRALDPL